MYPDYKTIIAQSQSTNLTSIGVSKRSDIHKMVSRQKAICILRQPGLQVQHIIEFNIGDVAHSTTHYRKTDKEWRISRSLYAPLLGHKTKHHGIHITAIFHSIKWQQGIPINLKENIWFGKDANLKPVVLYRIGNQGASIRIFKMCYLYFIKARICRDRIWPARQVVQEVYLILILHPCQLYRRTAIHCKFDHIGRRTDGRLTQLLIHQGKYDLIHIEAIDQAVEGLQGSAIHLKEGIGLRIDGYLEAVIGHRIGNQSTAV